MYRLSESIRSAMTKDGGIVLNIEHGQMLRTNRTGGQILELLKKGGPLPEIVSEIVRIYGISADRAESDVREFIDLLREHHLLQPQCTEERS